LLCRFYNLHHVWFSYILPVFSYTIFVFWFSFIFLFFIDFLALYFYYFSATFVYYLPLFTSFSCFIFLPLDSLVTYLPQGFHIFSSSHNFINIFCSVVSVISNIFCFSYLLFVSSYTLLFSVFLLIFSFSCSLTSWPFPSILSLLPFYLPPFTRFFLVFYVYPSVSPECLQAESRISLTSGWMTARYVSFEKHARHYGMTETRNVIKCGQVTFCLIIFRNILYLRMFIWIDNPIVRFNSITWHPTPSWSYLVTDTSDLNSHAGAPLCFSLCFYWRSHKNTVYLTHRSPRCPMGHLYVYLLESLSRRHYSINAYKNRNRELLYAFTTCVHITYTPVNIILQHTKLTVSPLPMIKC
jgi:hypothetical protein